MKILEICSGTLVNGAIIHVQLLCRELARRGHRVWAACRPDSWIGQQLADGPAEVVWSSLRRWPPGELRRVAQLVRQERIDVIHTHLSSAHFFGVLLRWMTGVPCVATAQSRHFQLHWMFNDRVVAVSEATRAYHCRWNLVRPGRTVTVHNFVDDRAIQAVPQQTREAVRRQLGVPDNALLAGAIGDLFPRKGQLGLVEAMSQVLREVPNAWLLLVGPAKDPRYTAQVRARAEQLGIGGRVVWAGQRDDVHCLLAAMDVKVLASLEESLPLAILEAMAAGLPVVATRVGGIPECVRHGETGLLVPPDDRTALAAAIAALLNDGELRRTFGAAAQRCIRERFSPESQTAAIERVFSDVAARRKAA
jgi:glycosyltransferase involved in cell wall biosynthesis